MTPLVPYGTGLPFTVTVSETDPRSTVGPDGPQPATHTSTAPTTAGIITETHARCARTLWRKTPDLGRVGPADGPPTLCAPRNTNRHGKRWTDTLRCG